MLPDNSIKLTGNAMWNACIKFNRGRVVDFLVRACPISLFSLSALKTLKSLAAVFN